MKLYFNLGHTTIFCMIGNDWQFSKVDSNINLESKVWSSLPVPERCDKARYGFKDYDYLNMIPRLAEYSTDDLTIRAIQTWKDTLEIKKL